jgi:cob(I)alamin adenosyltransferase
MKKSAIYTKTGDKGQTSLVSGTRVSKSNHRLHIYGEVDELNSHIGMAHALIKQHNVCLEELPLLEDIQSRLFDLGSNLACESANAAKYQLPQLKVEFVYSLEEKIDELDSQLPPLKNFILPGGHPIAASFHIARTICRRIERNLVSFSENNDENLPDNAMIYINRLSDLFFVMARFVNLKTKEAEIIWNPNK